MSALNSTICVHIELSNVRIVSMVKIVDILLAIDRGETISKFQELVDSCTYPHNRITEAPVLPGDPENAMKDSPITRAARRGLLSHFICLYNARGKIPCEDIIKATMVASQNGHVPVVQHLILLEASLVNTTFAFGTTPLSKAASEGQTKVVDVLIKKKADVNKANHEGASPLVMASEFGSIDVVKLLIRAKADVNQASDDGIVPLHMACQEDHCEVVKALLKAKANVDVYTKDDTDETPLYIAACNGNLSCCKHLRVFGARLRMKDCIMEAARNSHHAVATFLLRTEHWTTPLHFFSILTSFETRTLLRASGDVHATSDEHKKKESPLQIAAKCARTSTNGLTIGSPADLIIRAAMPWSPETHELFPDAARGWAVDVFYLGILLSHTCFFKGEEISLFDAWVSTVMPHAVERASGTPRLD